MRTGSFEKARVNSKVWRGVISPWAEEILRKNATGEVALVNSRGIYLAVAGEMLLLCDAGWGAVPAGISLTDFASFASLFPVAGVPFSVKDQILMCPGVKAELDLVKAAADDTVFKPGKIAFQKALSVLKRRAVSGGFAEIGAVVFENAPCKMDLIQRLAHSALTDLLKSIKEKNVRRTKWSAEKLMGLGPGLTPSGDDVLVGLYYGLAHSPYCMSAESLALKEALSAAGDKTTPVSASLLKAIASNAPFELLRGAWFDPKGADALVNAGSHSGSEMLLGLLCAMSLMETWQKEGTV